MPYCIIGNGKICIPEAFEIIVGYIRRFSYNISILILALKIMFSYIPNRKTYVSVYKKEFFIKMIIYRPFARAIFSAVSSAIFCFEQYK